MASGRIPIVITLHDPVHTGQEKAASPPALWIVRPQEGFRQYMEQLSRPRLIMKRLADDWMASGECFHRIHNRDDSCRRDPCVPQIAGAIGL